MKWSGRPAFTGVRAYREEEEEERSSIIDLKRHTQLAVAWSQEFPYRNGTHAPSGEVDQAGDTRGARNLLEPHCFPSLPLPRPLSSQISRDSSTGGPPSCRALEEEEEEELFGAYFLY